MKRNLLPIALIVLLIVGSLAFTGCSSSGKGSTPDEISSPDEQLSTGGPTAEDPLVLTWASWLPMSMPAPLDWDPYDFMHNRWCDIIEEETGGRVIFERYPAESLVKMPDMWDSVKNGVIDIGTIHPATDPSRFKMTNALALPGLFADSSVAAMTLTKLFEEGYTTSEWDDVHVIYWGINQPYSLINRARPVETLEDWKGLKIGAEGEPETSVLKAMGAQPVSMPVTDQYIALERGTIDGSILDLHGFVAFKFYEVADYITLAYGGARPVVMAMNKDTYNSLPADIKEVFDRNSGMLWAALHGARFDTNAGKARIFLEEYHAKENRPPLYDPPEEELAKWQKALEPVFEQVIGDLEDQGLPAREMLERCQYWSDTFASWELGVSGLNK